MQTRKKSYKNIKSAILNTFYTHPLSLSLYILRLKPNLIPRRHILESWWCQLPKKIMDSCFPQITRHFNWEVQELERVVAKEWFTKEKMHLVTLHSIQFVTWFDKAHFNYFCIKKNRGKRLKSQDSDKFEFSRQNLHFAHIFYLILPIGYTSQGGSKRTKKLAFKHLLFVGQSCKKSGTSWEFCA